MHFNIRVRGHTEGTNENGAEARSLLFLLYKPDILKSLLSIHTYICVLTVAPDVYLPRASAIAVFTFLFTD